MSRRARLIGHWDSHAANYDRAMSALERRFFPDSREWVCERATGITLEVAVGTGINLPLYSSGVTLTAIDWSEGMLQTAVRRARELALPVTLLRADATALPFADERFDSVVCTFSLCGIADERAALTEAVRVLRPGGSLLLADHIRASNPFARTVEQLVEVVTIPLQGEHFTRRPLKTVRHLGLEIVKTERLKYGAIEHVHARKR